MKIFFFIGFVIFLVFASLSAFYGTLQFEILFATLSICMFVAVVGEQVIQELKNPHGLDNSQN